MYQHLLHSQTVSTFEFGCIGSGQCVTLAGSLRRAGSGAGQTRPPLEVLRTGPNPGKALDDTGERAQCPTPLLAAQLPPDYGIATLNSAKSAATRLPGSSSRQMRTIGCIIKYLVTDKRQTSARVAHLSSVAHSSPVTATESTHCGGRTVVDLAFGPPESHPLDGPGHRVDGQLPRPLGPAARSSHLLVAARNDGQAASVRLNAHGRH